MAARGPNKKLASLFFILPVESGYLEAQVSADLPKTVSPALVLSVSSSACLFTPTYLGAAESAAHPPKHWQ